MEYKDHAVIGADFLAEVGHSDLVITLIKE